MIGTIFSKLPGGRFPVGILLAVVLLTSCGSGERTIVETRVLSEKERKIHVDATSKERFSAGGHSHGDEAGGAGAAPGNPFRWDKPEGWEEVAPTSMRVANFKLGEGGAAECYLTALPGAGGGVTANINRWRQQMGLKPWTQEDVDALETTMLLSQAAPFVAFNGTFSGMGGVESKEKYRLLGTVLSYDQFTLFVKMTGPADVVSKEEEKFKAFCSSLRIVSPGEPPASDGCDGSDPYRVGRREQVAFCINEEKGF